MTIEQKAREIAVKANLIWADAIAGPHPPTIAARLGIIEGLEMALAIYEGRKYGGFDQVADAIRALIEEQKV